MFYYKIKNITSEDRITILVKISIISTTKIYEKSTLMYQKYAFQINELKASSDALVA